METPVTTSHPLPTVDLSQSVLEPIGQDGAFVVCRAHWTTTSGEPASVLVVMPRGEHPHPACDQMLKHEYGLRPDLDATWAARPLALVQHQGRTCLVLDDPGGELLARRLGTPMELGLFLRVGVGLAAALGALHRKGIIHKDLTPGHVMIDEATGHVWLTGLRIASRLRRERQTPEPPEVIAGTIEPDGSRSIAAYGNPAPGARPLDADSVFEIGSITKVFTGILLADMADRGEVKLDDPVARQQTHPLRRDRGDFYFEARLTNT